MAMRPRWMILGLLTLILLAATGCASSRNGRYGRNDPYYDGVYAPRGGRVYTNRDYRWEQLQRQREWQLQRQRQRQWEREQRQQEAWRRKQERSERHRDRDGEKRHDRRYSRER